MSNLKFTAMKRTSLFFAASLMIMATISFTSCQKDEETDPIVTIAEQDDDANAYFDDVLTEVDDLTMVSNSKDFTEASNTLGQGTRTRKTTWISNTERIDSITYQNYVNGNSRFERVKNGLIIIHVWGNPLQNEFVREISFKDFTINGNAIEGTKRIEKTAQYSFTVTIQNGKVTFTDGTTYTRNCERIRTWADGFATPYNIWDDVYTIEGTATGVNRKGYTYTHQITNALMIKLNCRWIVQGTIDMTVDSKTATLDYGNGECDNIATVTANGKTWEIRLRGGI